MSFASSNRTAIRTVKEVTFGTTPATPALQNLRYTSESINYNLTNIVSNEIRDDRQRSDLVQVQSDAAGDLNIEMSYDSYDEYIQAAFADVWGTTTAVSSSATIDADDSDDSFNSSAAEFADLVVGQWVRMSGFSDPANNGFFRITTQTSAKIDVASTLVTEAAGGSIDVNGTMLRNGTVLSSYTIQKHLQDSTTETYINFTGVRIGGLTLSFQTGAIVTGAFSTMALGATVGESQIAGATTPAATTTGVLNAVGNLSSIWMDDSTSSAFFNSLTLNLNNTLRSQDAISNLPHVGIALGTIDLTGDINIYFEDKSMLDLYIGATAFSLAFAMVDDAGNAYVITMPKVKFESGEVVSGGLDTDVMFAATWRAIKDPITGCTIQIDKF